MMVELQTWNILNFFSVLLAAVFSIRLTARLENKTQTILKFESPKVIIN